MKLKRKLRKLWHVNLIAICFLIFMPLMQGCIDVASVCKDEVIEERVSPDGQRIAAVFTRDCGATTGWVTHVSVRWRTSNPSNNDLVFTSDNKKNVQLEWLDDLRLQISCGDCNEKDVSRRVTKLGYVTVDHYGQ